MTAVLPDQAQHVLQTIWGYPEFRGRQAEVVRQVTSGGNALVLMPTGGGKSLCYQLPSLLRSGTGIVVSPLIALMKDQVDALRQLGVRAAFLNSSLSSAEVRDVESALRRGELDLLYVAPERLLMPRTLELLERCEVALFAIDEAHCVSQWGHDFRPEYQQLSLLPERFATIPRVALTATADERTRADIKNVLQLWNAPEYISSFDRPNIQYQIGLKESPKGQLLDFIQTEHPGEAGIVYCLSRKSVEETAKWLTAQGLSAAPYHAGLSPRERNSAQERFLNEEGMIVVATVAFGMGIDKPNVRFVAHLDLPKSMEGYYQETGRAGRDGLPSTAWMVYGLSDVVNVRRMLAGSDAPEEVKRVEAGKLDALLTYCETAACRRQVLLSYFGETLTQPCGNCDNCLNPPKTRDLTREAQMALSAAVRTGNTQRGVHYGAAHLTDVLLGKQTERITALGHHQLPTFGVGAGQDEKTWRSIIRQLVSLGYLAADDHYGLSATAKAKSLLKGQTGLTLREDTLISQVKVKKERREKTALLDAADQDLFEALRSWRLTRARALAVPPYVVFSDATLKAVAQLRPSSAATLGAVSGIGQRKLADYGDEVLQIVRDQSAGQRGRPLEPQERGAAVNHAILDRLRQKNAQAQTQLLPARPEATEPNQEVETALRELRRELTHESGLSAFLIYTNAALGALATHQPRTLNELRNVPGLGEKRVQTYGQRILEAIASALSKEKGE